MDPHFVFGSATLGSFLIIDLVAATTNAFNGAVLARQPSHDRSFTVVGILLIGVVGGIGGGVVRDILLNNVPYALTNPWYIILCTVAALLALRAVSVLDQDRISRVYDFLAMFSLPWYAIVGTSLALAAGLPLVGCLLIGVVGPTAGRYFIDLTCGVTPQHFVRGEWFVGTAAMTSAVYVVLADTLALDTWLATIVAFLVGFSFRYVARSRKMEEPMPRQDGGASVWSS